jgi:hypothetical protein
MPELAESLCRVNENVEGSNGERAILYPAVRFEDQENQETVPKASSQSGLEKIVYPYPKLRGRSVTMLLSCSVLRFGKELH